LAANFKHCRIVQVLNFDMVVLHTSTAHYSVFVRCQMKLALLVNHCQRSHYKAFA